MGCKTNPDCPNYGKVGKVCHRTFSARRGTPLFGTLVEGDGIRATARIKGVGKDTVAQWLETASPAIWWSTCIKRRTTEYGDCWVWMSKVISAFVAGEISEEVNDGSLYHLKRSSATWLLWSDHHNRQNITGWNGSCTFLPTKGNGSPYSDDGGRMDSARVVDLSGAVWYPKG